MPSINPSEHCFTWKSLTACSQGNRLNCFVCAPTANLAKRSFSFLRGKNKKKWDLSKFHLFIIRFLDFGESKMLKGQAWEMMGACRNSFQVSGKPGNTNGYNLRTSLGWFAALLWADGPDERPRSRNEHLFCTSRGCWC